MPYKIGDRVVHPAHGVGSIVGFAERDFAGQPEQLYYEISIHGGTVWVPVEGPHASRLRPLTNPRDLSRYRKLLKSPPEKLDQDNRKRQVELSERLRQGSFEVLCEIVRDLTARGRQKPLNQADSNWLRRAREGLCQEWAESAGVSIEEAIQEVEAILHEGRQESHA
jgi:CarD family transcriptional regulator